jgi:hypothetical protein
VEKRDVLKPNKGRKWIVQRTEWPVVGKLINWVTHLMNTRAAIGTKVPASQLRHIFCDTTLPFKVYALTMTIIKFKMDYLFIAKGYI